MNENIIKKQCFIQWIMKWKVIAGPLRSLLCLEYFHFSKSYKFILLHYETLTYYFKDNSCPCFFYIYLSRKWTIILKLLKGLRLDCKIKPGVWVIDIISCLTFVCIIIDYIYTQISATDLVETKMASIERKLILVLS